jgi:putative tricarboxylic transport membrane protein
MTPKEFRLGAICAATVLSVAVAAAPASADDYFAGKSVSLLVGFDAGGGVDLTARMFSKYVGKHIPGNPSVIVKNMPGGSSMKAHNYVFESAKGDGQTLFYGPWFPASQILKAPGVRFTYPGFAMVAAFSTSGFMVFARNDIVPGGLKSPADILKAKDLKFSGQNPFNVFDLLGTLSIELFDVHYSYVTGYRGSAAIRSAMMKNETNIGVDSASGLNSVVKDTMIKPGIARVLWGFPAQDESGNWVRNDTLKEYPNVVEVYQDTFHKAPSGPAWDVLKLTIDLYANFSQLVLAPPSIKPEILADLSKGFYDTMADEAFQSEFEKRFGYRVSALKRPAAEKIIQSLKSLDPKVIAALKAHVDAGRKVKQ